MARQQQIDTDVADTDDIDVRDYFPWSGHFTRAREANPVLAPQGDGFEHGATYNATIVKKDGKTVVIYRGEDKTSEEDPEQTEYTSRVGRAESRNGNPLDLVRDSDGPILDPSENAEYRERGDEDPRVTKLEEPDKDGYRFYLTYTGFDGEDAHLMMERSKDLEHWDHVGKIADGKAGAILDRKINGEYVMYQGDKNIDLYTSRDGTHWDKAEDAVLRHEDNPFGTELVEPGPAPMLVEHDGHEAILLIYNSCDEDGNYHVGAALFDRDDPSTLLDKTEEPIFSPDERVDKDEKHPHLENVVFAEGLVEQDGTYYLTYGSGDIDTRVATAPAKDTTTTDTGLTTEESVEEAEDGEQITYSPEDADTDPITADTAPETGDERDEQPA